jgi:hypothetical protein
MDPVYNIILQAAILHPPRDVWNATFDSSDVVSTTMSANDTETMLNLTPLRYATETIFVNGLGISVDHSQLSLRFEGVIGALAYTAGFIQLHGDIEFQSSPSNGHVYEGPIIFPKVFIRNLQFTFDLVSTSSDRSDGDLVLFRESALWLANISLIAGPVEDLRLLIELNDTYLNITEVKVTQIG